MGDKKQVKEMYHQLIQSTTAQVVLNCPVCIYLYSDGVNNDSN